MLKRFFSSGVELDLGAGSLKVRTTRELDLALSGKTSLSSLKVTALGGLADDALLREADAYNRMEQRIVRVLSQPPGTGNGLSDFLAELDLSLVTEDNDWRAILRSVKILDGARDDYKRTALLKYMDYLSSGQEFVRTIRSNRRHQHPASNGEDSGAHRTPSDLSPRQALIFDLPDLAGTGDTQGDPEKEEFNRLPKGETLEVEFAAHQSLGLMMARYKFTIVAGSPFLLLDDNGNDLRLRSGKNIVGRSAQCDVAVDPIYRAVSRKHVIVEANGGGVVKLTDISTLGTFVPRVYLDNKLH